jgi:hypothetical protein
MSGTQIKKVPLRSENVEYWYFRLNGCLTIPNFVVHPDQGRDQRTDVDIVAVRFPHRAELLTNPMRDDGMFTPEHKRIRIVFAEVKTGQCNLNGPWTNRPDQNMQLVLKAIGPFPEDMTNVASNSLYTSGAFLDSVYNVSLFCIGSRPNEEIRNRFPEVPQLTWEALLGFIFDRFRRYRRQKVAHPQWDETGRALWELAMEARDVTRFRGMIDIVA